MSVSDGGTLPARDWWPNEQRRSTKPHILKRRGIWFFVYGGQVFAWRLGNPLFFNDHRRVKPS
jgi:hypothetical protein